MLVMLVRSHNGDSNKNVNNSNTNKKHWKTTDMDNIKQA